MSDITGATAILTIAIPGLFNAPQQLQGFAADDIYTVDNIESAEVLMGADGFLSAGFVYVPVRQNITLQADSDSNKLFEFWWSSNQSIRGNYFASGVLQLPAIGSKWAQTRGVLTGYKPIPDGKKLLQPRTYGITWQRVAPQPTA